MLYQRGSYNHCPDTAMRRSKANCHSARKLPEAHDQPKQPTNITLKQLSLSFYNTSTKKSKKQIVCDYDQSQEPSVLSDHPSRTQHPSRTHHLGKTQPLAKSVSLRKESSSKKWESRESKESKDQRQGLDLKECLQLNPFIRPSKSNNFQIKNLVIQNYFPSPYSVPQSKFSATTVLRTKSQIKSAKKKMAQEINLGDRDRDWGKG